MKKLSKYLLALIVMFICPLFVKANTINSINMDIYIDNNGTAHVTENWKANYSSNTEIYKGYANLGNTEITNFTVSMDGKTFTYDDDWDIDGSFSDKAYKNGFNYTSDGVELCWGISNYGTHTYTLSYEITGFVVALNDSDMVYWNLIPPGMDIGNVYIKIYSDFAYDDSLDVWGYGKYGAPTYVYDGYIEMTTDNESLDSDEYMTILIKFDKGTFSTSSVENEDFDYYYDMAEDGATNYKQNTGSKILGILGGIFSFIINIAWVVIVGVVAGKTVAKANNTLGTKQFDFEKDGRKLPKEVPNIRDIPFNKDIYKTFWISQCYKLGKQKTDFLGAILLKWLKEKKIEIKKVQTGLLKNKEESTIVLHPETFSSDNELETNLHKMMVEASKDGILESKEFEKWCKNHYSKILSWFDKIIDYESDELVKEGKLIDTEKKGILLKRNVLTLDSSLRNDGITLKGLKNFLEEFSRIDDKEAIEVNMWEYYLIYAQILGIADKVAKQFKKLYPEIVENNNYGYDYSDIMFIHMISTSGMSSATTAKSRAESYSSGGGGFSSGGGGGGSFGGGGSIGSR